MLEAGIKPIYVFDGKAPELKIGELKKRSEKRKDAQEKLNQAETEQDVSKFTKRLVKVTKQHNEDCKKLLELLGCPIVTAPSEAEAQCAQLCKEGLVYGIATEDMDGLTFATPRLIRNLSNNKSDSKAKEYTFSKIIEGLEITYDQFVDLCILMGCDYCESIKGIGGKKGLELIRKYGSIEGILKEKFNITEYAEVEITYNEITNDQELKKATLNEENDNEEDQNNENNETKENINESIDSLKEEKIDEDIKNEDIKDEDVKDEDTKEEETNEDLENDSKNKINKKNKEIVPKNWLFKGARQLFKEPNVLVNQIKESDLKFKEIDEEGLIKFLCEENGFNEDRIRPAINRVKQSKKKTNQTRIDSFFKPSETNIPNIKKRPSSDNKNNSKVKKRKPK
ncbi:hypothetical protein RND71_043518 [Anisodus tanguticus]|uniref:XPG-I domain-containing protein n=1 Tax=Anisodus tanguticus TaxID=243964 RepID=A0AAE1QPE2_9SOLA|nr:hypothetical protein RND71_043518 [Anisodus tanguticus]